ncbi:hypothetical protein [Schlesneria paludicola]|uniref:hypothetical protein n=1 Tax=Schlesneria paludicola TaxID=360056 RepID=UPI00029AC317|nr:hypothetical protein [Schlesneria paludicola]
MAKYLLKVMRAQTYAEVIEALIVGGVVERFAYVPGAKSFGYRLDKRYLEDKHIRVKATDLRLIRRLAKFHAQAAKDVDARMKPVHRQLAKLQAQLEIDGDAARKTIAGLDPASNPYDCQGINVQNIESRDFYANVSQYGRLANSISTLKRELRKHLHVRNQSLVSVDVANAQPALLGKLAAQHRKGEQERIKSRGKYDSRFSDLEQYIRLVQSGEFYDHFALSLNAPELDRDAIKKKILADVIAKKGKYQSKVEDKFRELFPSVYRFIKKVNANDHANLIRLLQREESHFVIETVAANFIATNPGEFVISLHDSLYSTRKNLHAIEQSFQRGFEQTGFPMTLKVHT